MTRIVLAALIACGFLLQVTAVSASDHETADTTLPQGHQCTITKDAVQVGTTLQLSPVGEAPVACVASLRGVMALTEALRLCICDGRMWILESSGTVCDWTATTAGKAYSP